MNSPSFGNIPPVDSGDVRAALHDRVALEAFRRRERLDPDRLRRMFHALYQLHEPLAQALTRLPPSSAATLRQQFLLTPLHIQQRRDSQQDRSTKLLLRAADGALLETVLMRSATGRLSVCVSSQVGCRAGCPFCATARMGLQRQLSGTEIIEQILIAARLTATEGRRLRNVVFMGMGEPLDNEQALHAAADRIFDQRFGLGIPARRVLLSTVGVPDAMCRLIDRYPGFHMALSLHSARPELRSRIVPWSRKYDWQDLHAALRYVAERHCTHRHQGPVMVEHLMAAGVNDRREDAEALIAYLQGIPAHVNLIPYNQIPGGPPWQPTPRAVREVFANRLRDAGIFTTIRYSMGADIQAACGQLAVEQPV